MNVLHSREVVIGKLQHVTNPNPGLPMAFGQGIGHEAGRQEPGLVEVDNSNIARISKDEVAGIEVTIIET